MAWSPDGKRIASASGDCTVQVWNAADGSHVYTYRGHPADVSTLAWSPDGKYIAVGSSASMVEIWYTVTGHNVYSYQGHNADVLSVAWSPDGKRIVSGSSDGTAQVWDAFTGNNAYTYRGHADYYWGHLTSNASVNTMAWSLEGSPIASGSNDMTVQVWEAK